MEQLKKLEKELNSFPRDIIMDPEAKKKISEALTEHSRSSRKSLRRVATPLRVWGVGLASVAVACMLFLPSILKEQPQNSNKSSPGIAQINIPVKPTTPPQKTVGQKKENNPQEHPAAQLEAVKELVISKDGSRNSITDSSILAEITKDIASSTYIGGPDKVKDDGTDYILSFTLKDGSLSEFQFRTNTKPNLFDIQKQEWRVSMALEYMLADYLPTKNLDEKQIRGIAQKLYPSGHFDTEVGARLADSKPLGLPGNQVWIIEGTNDKNERIKVYLDPKDGSVIKKEPLVSTDGVSPVVEAFYKDIADKNATDAWNYIHSKSKRPNPSAKETNIQKTFNNYVQKTNIKLKSIDSVKWELVWTKNPDCMCSIEDSVVVNATMSDGSPKRFHVLLDADHKWKLYFSSSTNDLE